MATIYYDKDANLDLIKGKKIAVIGYGSQGHAHALNLRDSGADVRVGLPAGSRSRAKAEGAGLRVATVAQAAAEADLIMVLAPDQTQKKILRRRDRAGSHQGEGPLLRARVQHTFPPDQAPRGRGRGARGPEGPRPPGAPSVPGGRGIPCLIAVHQDGTGQAKGIGLAYARGIGGTRAGVLETTFKEETETDLFGEQAVLCGGAWPS